jgi:2-polyprenyl-3-methyl-5-hydroxy-6-metoxy-1,4-benzoquinol methylase
MLPSDNPASCQGGGFPQDAFERIAATEPGNYWFESRNRLITWAIQRYFPKATTLHEVGCGTGFVLQAAREAFPRLQISASDFLENGLTVARRRVPSATFFQIDARHLDLPAQYDVVCAFDVLEHIGDDARAIERVFAAVRPGGGALVTVPQHPQLWSRADEKSHHVRRYRRRELVERLRQAGFEITRVTSFVSLLLPVMALSRWVDARRKGEFDGREFQVSKTTNAVLRSVLSFERLLIRLGVSWPAGGSLLAVVRRPLA